MCVGFIQALNFALNSLLTFIFNLTRYFFPLFRFAFLCPYMKAQMRLERG